MQWSQSGQSWSLESDIHKGVAIDIAHLGGSCGCSSYFFGRVGVTVWGTFSLKILYYLVGKNSPFNIYLYFGKGTVEIYRGMLSCLQVKLKINEVLITQSVNIRSEWLQQGLAKAEIWEQSIGPKEIKGTYLHFIASTTEKACPLVACLP